MGQTLHVLPSSLCFQRLSLNLFVALWILWRGSNILKVPALVNSSNSAEAHCSPLSELISGIPCWLNYIFNFSITVLESVVLSLPTSKKEE